MIVVEPVAEAPSTSVAAIIPAYQAESTLGAALASVAGQSVQPAEVVVCDDGSSDATIALARSWQDHLPIRVVQTSENLGPAGARRAAIAASTAELVALLDADDVWFPDHLSSMLAVYDTTSDGLASADVLRWIPGRALGARPLSDGAPLPPPHAQLSWVLTTNRLSVSALFSRHRYEEVGGFRTQFRGTEDWDLWIRMVRAGAVVVRPPHPTVLYRLSEGSVSSDALVHARRAVLQTAADETDDATRDAELRAVRTGMRLVIAEGHLHAAYAAAGSGRSVAARVAGLRALVGVRSVALRGLAMALAPSTVARRRQEVHYEPEFWLRR